MGEPLILQLFIASSIPVVKICLICGIGAFCARKGLLTAEGRRVLGALSFLVFNPALIFVKLASTLTPSRLVHWWPLVLNTGISTVVGLGLGYLGVRLVRPADHLRPHTIVAIALGNLGNLPLVIVSSLASSSASVLHGIPADRAEDLAVSYVVVGLLLPVLAHATLGFNMLRKPSGAAALPEPKTSVAAAGAATDSSGAEAAAPCDTASESAEDPLGSPCFRPMDSLVQQRRQQRQPLLLGQQDSFNSARFSDRGLDLPPLASPMPLAATPLSAPSSASGLYGCTADGAAPAASSSHQVQQPESQRLQQQQLGMGQAGGGCGGGDETAAPGMSMREGLPSVLRGQSSVHDIGKDTVGHGGRVAAAAGPSEASGRKGLEAVVVEEEPMGPGLELQMPRSGGSVVELPQMAAVRGTPTLAAGGTEKHLLLPSGPGSHTRGARALPSPRRRLLRQWSSRVNWRSVGRQVVKEATSPPLLAILLSVPVGCVAPLQQAFFGGPGAPLALLKDCLAMLGDCTIPAILIILGATLANGPGAAAVPLRVISLVTATRLVLLPLLGLALVMGAYAARLFEAPDPIYLLVLLIQNTAPTAIMVHTMASVQSNRAEEVSTILFWGYIVGIAAIPVWLTLFLYVVKQDYRSVE